MGLKSTFRRFFDLEETIDPSETVQAEQAASLQRQRVSRTGSSERNGKIIALQNIHQQGKVILAEPQAFDEVENVVDHLKNKRIVICSLQRAPRTDAQRILDFISGTVFALNGQVRSLGEDTFLFTPDQVDISGVISHWRDKE